MAVQQNPVLTDGWWVVKQTERGRELGILTDGWWFPECLPLDEIYFNLGVGITPQFGLSIVDQLQLSLGITISSISLQAEIDREKELSISVNKEEELPLSITQQVDLDVEG